MKKRIVILLIAALCLLLSASALAENSAGRGTPAVQNDGIAAYLDGKGNLLIPGNDLPINERPADSIISIDPYRLFFLSRTNAGTDAEQTALVCMDLSTFEERVLYADVYAACSAGDDQLYFISASDRTQLYRADFEHDLISVVYTSAEPLEGLFVSAEGLVATCVENAGAVIYIAATDSFEPYGDSIPSKTVMHGGAQIFIADGGTLYIHRQDSLAAEIIDVNVSDFALLDGDVYYLSSSSGAVRVKVYSPDRMEQRAVATPTAPLEGHLTASQRQLFVLGTDSAIYRLDPESGVLEKFSSVMPPLLDAGKQVDSYSIVAMNGLLNLYANLSQTTDTPAFTFVEFASDLGGSATEPMLIQSFVLDGEETSWTLLQPAKPYSPLQRGSRGDAVSAIQQPLYDHGYYDYYIDGIFGYRTDFAVRMLQSDLGLAVTGVADESLQRQILSGSFPTYDPYLSLSRGDVGLRVQQMQQRLRSLGYLADGADGIFGPRTQAAVQLFQQENNLAISGNATRETLMKLYSASTAPCSSYIDLYPGDSGYRVRALNKRLKGLFYLEGSVTDTYTAATSEAVRRFQAQVGLYINGNATAAVQQRLFAPGAPECVGYSELRRGDENVRVSRLQRRLKELNYFSGSVTGYFGRQTQAAVKLFQQTVGMRPTGVATVAMQKLLFSPSAPVYVKPTVIGTPVIAISCYDRFDNGVYYLSTASSENGYVTFSWSAEGDVANYNITIVDALGNVCLDQNTLLTMTSVPISTLTVDRLYTLKITAYPSDGSAAHVTGASLSFCRTEKPTEPDPGEIGTISRVYTSIEPVTRMENDVYYVQPGTITFRWYAEGDVASYYVEIRDSRSNLCIQASTPDEQASLSTDNMQPGEIYTLCVYAIPTNGTIEHATLKTQSFALETQIPETPALSAPTIVVENLTPDESGLYTATGDNVTLRWDAVENAVQYYIEIRDASNAFCTGDTTTATGYVINTASLASGATYTVFVTAVPADGNLQESATASVRIATPQDQVIVQLPAPTLSVLGVQPSADGIAYVASTQPTFQWTSVDGAGAYNAVVRDSNGSILSEMTLNELSITYDASALSRGAVYTFSVIAVPQEGLNAQGTAATLPFIISLENENALVTDEEPEITGLPESGSDPEETDTPAEPEPAEVPSEPQASTAPNTTSESEKTAASGVEEKSSLPEAPGLSIAPVEEMTDSVVYVQEGDLSFSWHSDGASAYYAEILDAAGNICTSMTTEREGAALSSANLVSDAVYTLRVTALPADGTDSGAVSELRFAKRSAAVSPDTPDEPIGGQTEDAGNAPDKSGEGTETPADLSGEPTKGTSTEGVPTERPIASISAPVVSIQPAVRVEEGITYVQSGAIQLSWPADGDVAGYHIEIVDASGVLTSTDTAETQVTLSTDGMASDTLYALRAYAIPQGGTIEDSLFGEAYFALIAPEPEVPAEDSSLDEPPAYQAPEKDSTQTEAPVADEPEAPDDPYYPYDGDPWSVPLDENSAPEVILAVQQRLVDLNWLNPDDCTPGTLDAATLTAVYNFQLDYNANYGGTLTVITAEFPIVDTDTLAALMTAELTMN